MLHPARPFYLKIYNLNLKCFNSGLMRATSWSDVSKPQANEEKEKKIKEMEKKSVCRDNLKI